MNKDELLVAVCQSVLAETDPVDGWSKLMLIGKASGSSASLGGYSFDATGQWKAVSPRGGRTLELLAQLNAAMAADSPTGRPWLACLLRISRNGEIGADFEYNDAARWAVTPRTMNQRIQELAAMSV
jgi:hypothetical protein